MADKTPAEIEAMEAEANAAAEEETNAFLDEAIEKIGSGESTGTELLAEKAKNDEAAKEKDEDEEKTGNKRGEGGKFLKAEDEADEAADGEDDDDAETHDEEGDDEEGAGDEGGDEDDKEKDGEERDEAGDVLKDFMPEDFATGRELGMNDDEIRSFGSAKNFRHSARMMDRALQNQAEYFLAEEKRQGGEKKEKEEEVDEFAELDDYDDPKITALREQNKKLQAEAMGREDKQDDAQVQAQQDSDYRWLDGRFSEFAEEFGKDFVELFGSGDRSKLSQDQARQCGEVVMDLDAMLKNRPNADAKKVMRKAILASEFGERLRESAKKQGRKEVQDKVKKNSKRRKGTPSGRHASTDKEDFEGREWLHPDVVASHEAASIPD